MDGKPFIGGVKPSIADMRLAATLEFLAVIPDRKGGAIDVRLRASDNDNVVILFSDDGCGMSLDVRRQAFNPFFTTRRDGGRVGPGLHIVHNIVTHRLGGQLHLDSAPGEGTRVQIIVHRMVPAERLI